MLNLQIQKNAEGAAPEWEVGQENRALKSEGSDLSTRAIGFGWLSKSPILGIKTETEAYCEILQKSVHRCLFRFGEK
jgi:hypothetical protein